MVTNIHILKFFIDADRVVRYLARSDRTGPTCERKIDGTVGVTRYVTRDQNIKKVAWDSPITKKLLVQALRTTWSHIVDLSLNSAFWCVPQVSNPRMDVTESPEKAADERLSAASMW